MITMFFLEAYLRTDGYVARDIPVVCMILADVNLQELVGLGVIELSTVDHPRCTTVAHLGEVDLETSKELLVVCLRGQFLL